jgi:hypothetical protein
LANRSRIIATPAQMLLERDGDFGKEFARRAFDMERNRPDDTLFQCSATRLGSRANIAFDAKVRRGLGGFDQAIGAGTAAHGADDLAAFFRAVVRHQLVCRPAAIVWHRHHRDMRPCAIGRSATVWVSEAT